MSPIDLDLVVVTGGNTNYPVRMSAAQAATRLEQVQQNVRSAVRGNSANDLMQVPSPNSMMMMGLPQPR